MAYSQCRCGRSRGTTATTSSDRSRLGPPTPAGWLSAGALPLAGVAGCAALASGSPIPAPLGSAMALLARRRLLSRPRLSRRPLARSRLHVAAAAAAAAAAAVGSKRRSVCYIKASAGVSLSPAATPRECTRSRPLTEANRVGPSQYCRGDQTEYWVSGPPSFCPCTASARRGSSSARNTAGILHQLPPCRGPGRPVVRLRVTHAARMARVAQRQAHRARATRAARRRPACPGNGCG